MKNKLFIPCKGCTDEYLKLVGENEKSSESLKLKAHDLQAKLSRSEELNRELVEAANKYIAEKENVVPDLTLIRHTFKRLKESVARVKEMGK